MLHRSCQLEKYLARAREGYASSSRRSPVAGRDVSPETDGEPQGEISVWHGISGDVASLRAGGRQLPAGGDGNAALPLPAGYSRRRGLGLQALEADSLCRKCWT